MREHTISVSGDATVNVIPDKVCISLGVETVGVDLNAVMSMNDESSARLLKVFKSFNIAAKDVQTDHISIEPSYREDEKDGHRRKLVDYSVSKTTTITLRDVSKFDALLTAAVGSGANQVLDVQFLASDLRKYRDQAREMAMKAAREKADLLAGALGQQAGKATEISEGSNSSSSSYGRYRSYNGSYSNQSQNAVGGGGQRESEGSGETTAPGQTQVNASVRVTFLLQ